MKQTRRISGPTPGPTLYRLASERRYERIPIHVKSNPQDVEWVDQYGSTALHILCRSQNIGDALLHAADGILAANSNIAGQPNGSTWTPLHLACEQRLMWRNDIMTEPLVLKLIDACPEAVSTRLQSGFKAKTPFHIACENDASLDVLTAMLRVDPKLATQPYTQNELYSEQPLQILWNSLTKNHRQPNTLKMEVLLRAAYCGTVVDDDANFRILPAACSIRCPRDYVSHILSTYPDQISVPDSHGLLPLHHTIKSADQQSALYTDFLIEELVTEFPDAASMPMERGVLPLHTLIADREMTWHKGGVRHVVLAFADALRKADPRSGLFPFMTSAMHATQSRMHLSTTYELLRAAPEVIGFSTAALLPKQPC